jgi:UDP-N-acetyl-D-mannosaminuronic acid dehydrogenase
MNGPKNLLKRIKMLIKKNNKSIDTAKIFLIGLAFKGNPETSDLRDSTSIQFLELFKNKKNIYGFDYRVTNEEIKKLDIKPVSLEQGFKNSDIVIFLNNHKSYSDLNISKLSKSMKKPAVIFDCWQVFEPSEIKKLEGILYGGLAVG